MGIGLPRHRSRDNHLPDQRKRDQSKPCSSPYSRDDLDNLVLTFRKPLEMVPGKDNFDEKLKSFDLAAGKKLSDLLLSDVLDSLPK